MVKSKAWNWEMVNEDSKGFWKEPSIESYYLVSRWKSQNKSSFLDLGCGLGRHTVLFASNGFKTYAFDLSKSAIEKTREWCNNLNLNVDYKVGDMLELPYEDNFFDCILCRTVISHTDTKGVFKIAAEIKRVLKENGECYLTLNSKEALGYKQKSPVIDENTKIKIENGPENGVPHFYADYGLLKQIFQDFKIVLVNHIEDDFERDSNYFSSWHYHILIKKI